MDKKPSLPKSSRFISNECLVEVQVRIPKKSLVPGICWAPEVAQFMLDAFPQSFSTMALDGFSSHSLQPDYRFLDDDFFVE